nr:hypothetical protein CFP56_17780 [Quercus suber]
MAPSSNQNSSTSTPTDPDLRLTPTPQSTPPLSATPTMPTHSPTLQNYDQEMANLEQIWNNLSLEHTHNEMARLGDVEALYRIKTTTRRHQCVPLPTARIPSTWGVPNESLTPFSSSMKMIAWNCQGAGNKMFRTHAYELHYRHSPNILIVIKPRIAKARAQAVIDTLLYSHSRRVDPAGFFGSIWLLWNEGPSFIVEIITCSGHSIHALVKVSSPSFSFLLTAVYAPPPF